MFFVLGVQKAEADCYRQEEKEESMEIMRGERDRNPGIIFSWVKAVKIQTVLLLVN